MQVVTHTKFSMQLATASLQLSLLPPLKERSSVTHFVTKGLIILTLLGVQPCQIILQGIFTCSGCFFGIVSTVKQTCSHSVLEGVACFTGNPRLTGD